MNADVVHSKRLTHNMVSNKSTKTKVRARGVSQYPLIFVPAFDRDETAPLLTSFTLLTGCLDATCKIT